MRVPVKGLGICRLLELRSRGGIGSGGSFEGSKAIVHSFGTLETTFGRVGASSFLIAVLALLFVSSKGNELGLVVRGDVPELPGDSLTLLELASQGWEFGRDPSSGGWLRGRLTGA